MRTLRSLSPILFLIMTIAFIQNSGNDKAMFLILFPIIYSLVLSALNLIKIVKNFKVGIDNRLYFDFMFAIFPILYICMVILLARKGIIDSMLFLEFK